MFFSLCLIETKENEHAEDLIHNCSLREAFNAANDETSHPGADYVVFASGVTGTISLASPLTLSSDINIQGPGANMLEVTRGSSANFRIFLVYNGATPGPTDSISGIAITNGHAAGSLRVWVCS